MNVSERAQFSLTDEQRAIAGLAAEIAEREIAPHIAAWDRAHAFPRELYTKLNDAGLMGLIVPEAYGGVDAGYVAYARAVEELARVDAGTAVTFSVHTMICNAIVKLGSEEQKQKWLPRLAAGDAIAAFALTESDAGSDAAAIRATAKKTADGYLLNGRKQWCTNGTCGAPICTAGPGYDAPGPGYDPAGPGDDAGLPRRGQDSAPRGRGFGPRRARRDYGPPGGQGDYPGGRWAGTGFDDDLQAEREARERFSLPTRRGLGGTGRFGRGGRGSQAAPGRGERPEPAPPPPRGALPAAISVQGAGGER